MYLEILFLLPQVPFVEYAYAYCYRMYGVCSICAVFKLYPWATKDVPLSFNYTSDVPWSIFTILYTIGNRNEYYKEELQIYVFTLTVTLHYLVKL